MVSKLQHFVVRCGVSEAKVAFGGAIDMMLRVGALKARVARS